MKIGEWEMEITRDEKKGRLGERAVRRRWWLFS
jgi:hypothetical protein